MSGGSADPLEAARTSGLIGAGDPLVVLVSGGADSVCLLHVALEIGAEPVALHLNHGLREEAGADERFCRELCERLGVELCVEPARPATAEGAGNLQAAARELRYAHAERLSRARGSDYAAAHTRTDQAETVLYRLATSPGSRSLLAMAPRRGRLVRPLLAVSRADTRAWCEARGIGWREDASNEDPRYARARIRADVLPALEQLSTAAEPTIAETARQLAEEAELLDRLTADALERLGSAAVDLSALKAEPVALQRLVLRELARRASGTDQPLSRSAVEAITGLAGAGGTRSLDLGGGLRAIVEYGVVRFSTEADAEPPAPARLLVPGAVAFGQWDVEARLDDNGDALLRSSAVAGELVVRAWQDGDRMRPVGVGGAKRLQDLFTDAKVPRALRRSLPVVESGGEIAWVAGVAVDERFAAPRDTPPDEVVSLSALHSRRE